ncbi:MAG: hypothetical protein FJ102_23120 [Deltaproteobacteria bacterium]|nr:hypothetical protein [Deltaproteobacteria bacterium]
MLPLLLTLLVGCADPFGDAKKADTIEAWTTYLATEPSGTNKMRAEKRLEELLVKKAEESKAIPDYDAVLKRFPGSKKKKDMQAGRANAAFAVADTERTEAGWKKFIVENEFADAALKKRAKSMLTVAKYASALAMTEPVVEQVNLAEDPKGPKDGWGFSTEVANNSDKTFDYMVLELVFLDADGKKLKAATYPLVAGTGPGGMPIEEAYTKPLEPGAKRAWKYSTGEVPEGWSQKVSISPVSINVAGEAAADK